MNDIQVVVTGLAWMGAGIRSIETALDEMLRSAQDEVLITAYSIGNASDRILGRLEGVLTRGVQIRMIVNRLSAQPTDVVDALKSLQSAFPHCHLYSFESTEKMTDLHAKTVVVDRKTALVGSANISYRGWTTNHELALLVSGAAANKVAAAIDRLLSSAFCVPVFE